MIVRICALLAGFICLHLCTLYLLASRRSEQALCEQRKGFKDQYRSDAGRLRRLQTLAWCVSISTVIVPVYTVGENAILQTGARIVSFFYACKLLDIAVVRAHRPPRLYASTDDEAPMTTSRDRVWYAWLLFTEMRYHSFDIAVHQRQRKPQALREHLAWTLMPLSAAAGLVLVFPSLSLAKVFFVLTIIQSGLEALHTLLHPFCPHRLFYEPVAAASFGDFWSTHWQACASPWLRSLAYIPGRLIGGRVGGVLMMFCLSGIWHAWACAAASTRPWTAALLMWIVFMVNGVGCVVERRIWTRPGSLSQRVIVWVVAILSASLWFRMIECSSKVPLPWDPRC